MSKCHMYTKPRLCRRDDWTWCRNFDWLLMKGYIPCARAGFTCYTLAPWPLVCASRGRFVGGVWRRA